jgi:hypothetical protein
MHKNLLRKEYILKEGTDPGCRLCIIIVPKTATGTWVGGRKTKANRVHIASKNVVPKNALRTSL